MKTIKSFLFFLVILILFSSFKPTAEGEFVDAKELIENFEFYIGKTIITEGDINHFCGIRKIFQTNASYQKRKQSIKVICPIARLCFYFWSCRKIR